MQCSTWEVCGGTVQLPPLVLCRLSTSTVITKSTVIGTTVLEVQRIIRTRTPLGLDRGLRCRPSMLLQATTATKCTPHVHMLTTVMFFVGRGEITSTLVYFLSQKPWPSTLVKWKSVRGDQAAVVMALRNA